MVRLSFRPARTAYRVEGHRVLDHVTVVEADGEVTDVEEFGDRLQTRLQMPGASQHVLLVVHGRGPEPRRFIARRRWLRQIEVGYGVTAFMLHWPSWRGPMGWPETEACSAGQALGQMVEAAAGVRHSRDQQVTLALMTHSMGAYVVATAADLKPLAAEPPALDTILVHAPAVPLAGHAHWAAKLQARRGVFIMVNDRDLILHNARALRAARGPRLGAAARALRLGSEPLAPGVTYIDATVAGTRHAYFLPSIRRLQPRLFDVQAEIMRGQVPELRRLGAVPLPANGTLWTLSPPWLAQSALRI